MALIKFGGGVAGISGKIGGTVFARNKAGAYARNWAKPTSTPTAKQTVNRARFGNQSAAWGAVSVAKRDGWNAAAVAITLLNRMGEAYVPTGRQMFLSANNQLAAAQLTPIEDVPANFVPPTISPNITVNGSVVAGNIGSLLIGLTGVDASKFYSVEATGQMADIKENLTNVYRFIGSLAGSAMDINTAANWSALYGTNAEVGNVIWFRIKTVSVDNGMSSSPIIFKVTLV
jgi:hypothetical protein